MNRVLLIILVLSCMCGMSGCGKEKYQLPQDEFCYSTSDSQEIEISEEGQQYIIELLNDSKWVNDLGKCITDFGFHTEKQELRYSSDCGVFNDITNKKMLEISEAQRVKVNEFLGVTQ